MRTRIKVAALALLAILIILFLFFQFAYFLPVKNEHAKIAQLPSHDLSPFQKESYSSYTHYTECDEYGNAITFYADLTYNGKEIRTNEEILALFGLDAVDLSEGYYLYDEKNDLFMELWQGESPGYDIKEYRPYVMYFESAIDPFLQVLFLGPMLAWSVELSDEEANESGTISSARYGYLHPSGVYDTELSIANAAFQIALALTVCLVPLFVCLVWRTKKIVLITIGLYLFAGVINVGYYLSNYPWLSW